MTCLAPCAPGQGASKVTVWHKIFAGSNFRDFSSENKLLQIKVTANIFPAKNYSRVNILSLKFTTQK